MKRIFDIVFAIILLVLLFCPSILIAIAIKLTSKGKILYWSDRVGENNNIFKIDEKKLENTILKNDKKMKTLNNFDKVEDFEKLKNFRELVRGGALKI